MASTRPAAPCRTPAHPTSPTPRAGRTSVLPWPPAAPTASAARSSSGRRVRRWRGRFLRAAGPKNAVRARSASPRRPAYPRRRGRRGVVGASSRRWRRRGRRCPRSRSHPGRPDTARGRPAGRRTPGCRGAPRWRRRPRVDGLDSDGWAAVGGPGSAATQRPVTVRPRSLRAPRPGTGMAAGATAGGALVATPTAGTDTVTGPPGPTEAVRSSRDSGRPPAARSWPRGCWQRTCSVPGSPGVAGSANDASRMGTGTGGRTPGPAEPVAHPLHRPNQSDCATR